MALCRSHGAYNCRDANCRRQAQRYGSSYSSYTNSNAGDLSYDMSSGDLAIGIGGGLAIDTANGDLAVQVGGVSFDLPDFGGGGDF
jgi:glycerol dehydrogenase-like iron-containing ADH family enzyme